jgi:hypothetical protein
MLSTTKYIYIYLEYHSVCPLVGIGTPSKSASPQNRGGGGVHSRLHVRWWGVPIQTTEEKAKYSVYSVLSMFRSALNCPFFTNSVGKCWEVGEN